MVHTYQLGALVRAMPSGYTLVHEAENVWRVVSFNKASVHDYGGVQVIDANDVSVFQDVFMYPEDAVYAAHRVAPHDFVRQDPNDQDAWLGEMIRRLPPGWSLSRMLSGRWRCSNFRPHEPGGIPFPRPASLKMGDADRPEGAILKAQRGGD